MSRPKYPAIHAGADYVLPIMLTQDNAPIEGELVATYRVGAETSSRAFTSVDDIGVVTDPTNSAYEVRRYDCVISADDTAALGADAMVRIDINLTIGARKLQALGVIVPYYSYGGPVDADPYGEHVVVTAQRLIATVVNVLGAGGAATGAIRYDVEQTLNDAEQLRACANAGAVSYVNGQALGDVSKARARYHIGAVADDDARLSNARTPTTHNQAWDTITGTPTTLSGYGIVDGGGGSPGGSDGQMQYNNGGAFAGASGVYYDDLNGRLGVGTNSPAAPLEISKTTASASFVDLFKMAAVGDYTAGFVLSAGANSARGASISFLENGAVNGSLKDTVTTLELNKNSGEILDFKTYSQLAMRIQYPGNVTCYYNLSAIIVRTQNYTLAALISAHPSPTFGDRSYISDASTSTWTGGANAVGGGSKGAPVNWDGSNWVYG